MFGRVRRYCKPYAPSARGGDVISSVCGLAVSATGPAVTPCTEAGPAVTAAPAADTSARATDAAATDDAATDDAAATDAAAITTGTGEIDGGAPALQYWHVGGWDPTLWASAEINRSTACASAKARNLSSNPAFCLARRRAGHDGCTGRRG